MHSLVILRKRLNYLGKPLRNLVFLAAHRFNVTRSYL